MPKVLLGLGGMLSDPACCVIRDGQLAAAVEQAKVGKLGRSGSFPDEAFQAALNVARTQATEITGVAVARPFADGPESVSQLELRARFPNSDIIVVEHHHAHAASAFYASSFDDAAVLSVDRAGDFRSAVLFRGEGRHLLRKRELYFPDSLGDLYNRVTELLGFEARADEHKVQWLSASGEPVFASVLERLIDPAQSGWPRFDRSFFDADRLAYGGFSAKFFEETGVGVQDVCRGERAADMARSLQTAVENTVVRMLGSAQRVAIAGGLAMNALLVRALEQRFPQVFVQPVGGNAGTALGAALYAWHNYYEEERRVPFKTLFLGPEFGPEQIKQVLENCKLRFHFLLTQGELLAQAVRALNENKIVAWMQGRMEFGPRALGNRSILASPLNRYSTENLNVFIKHREGFRKFAASVPAELADRYFKVGPNAAYLATVGEVRPEQRETFSGALLAGDLLRVHAVHKEDNPLYHALLIAVGESTGLPVLYNTSFNLFGDPLVCTPRDAVRSFYSSGIDALFAGNFYLEK